jgi:pyruvate/2-oxoglutarate dehydrogenase complex dihydrolipoamide dehydrogenase (E3) component
MEASYDLVVIGAGSAGLVAAPFASAVGARVLLVESDRIGGDCTCWQGYVAARNALFPGAMRGKRDGVPWVVFTDPEVGQVGLTEEEAHQRGWRIGVLRLRWSASIGPKRLA